MAALRAEVAGLGYSDVATVLNSGNVVFTAAAAPDAGLRIEKALAEEIGVPARVTVLDASELAAAVAGNPLLETADDPSRLFVAFFSHPSDRADAAPLLDQDWGAEAIALGSRVAYVWAPDGVIASRLVAAMARALGDRVTMRNWTTVLKVAALVGGAE